MRNNMSKDELIEHYSKKAPNDFIQYDGHCDLPPDGHFIDVDQDGYLFSSRHTQELMEGATVRILIRLKTPKEVALKMLDKMRQWITEDPYYEKINSFDEQQRSKQELVKELFKKGVTIEEVKRFYNKFLEDLSSV